MIHIITNSVNYDVTRTLQWSSWQTLGSHFLSCSDVQSFHDFGKLWVLPHSTAVIYKILNSIDGTILGDCYRVGAVGKVYALLANLFRTLV